VERLQQGLDISAVRKSAHWSVLQPKYNLMDRAGFEGPMQNVCIKHGIAVVPYYGLAAGFLTGKYRTAADLAGKARGGPGAAADYLNARGLKVLAALDAVASETGAKVAQVALAWLAAQPSVTAPIASATSVAQVAELLDALHLDLSTLQLAHLDAASAI
jgi:aryl-alcohol dehydrogenase-like predicted oxidoreductase